MSSLEGSAELRENSDSTVLGAVTVQYDDYVGTAAADDADALIAGRSLYQMVGLDRDQWLIVSVELARSQHSDRVSVYAIDRYKHPLSGLADLEAGPDFAFGVPVVAFDLPASVPAQDFMTEAFQRISVRLTLQSVTGQSLNVVDRRPVEDQI